MTKLALATQSAAFEQRVRRAFRGELNGELRRWKDGVTASDFRAVINELGKEGTDVVALGPDVPLQTALELAQAFEENRPEVTVLVVTKPSPQVYEAALRAGVRDVVASDASDAELRLALERALQTTDRRRRNLMEAGGATGATGRVITVVAPKGGSGKTAVATNLGVTLARIAPGKVAIVDLDLQFGDITPALDLRPEHTMMDIVRTPGTIDITALKVLLTKRDGGLFVLAAPDQPDEGEQIGEAVVHRAVDLLADEFQYVIVDTAAGLNEHTLAALEITTDLVLVGDLSVAGARSMRKLVSALDALELVPDARHFVLNRADSRVGMELADVVASVGITVDIRLPSARAVAHSMNEGTPLCEYAPRSAYSRRITELAARLAPVEVGRRPFWRR